ncbi:MAG: response regulator [Candidatus Tectomicrobia bacterium]|nr:response regulator [Candidatus Tectomicrobia bacterium]
MMFRLLRYFTITSFLAFSLVVVVAGVIAPSSIKRHLLEFAESKNVALAQAFANSLWPRFAPFLTHVEELNDEALRAHQETADLRQAVLAMMRGLAVVKVKVYDLEGRTVFSTDPRDIGKKARNIGKEYKGNSGFLRARQGDVTSLLTHRHAASSFEGTVAERDLLASYIPIRQPTQPAAIASVLEIYSDVTSLVEQTNREQRSIILRIIVIFLGLYAFLFFIVRRADRILHRQHDELQAARTELESRVKERTMELVAANRQLRAEIAERQQAEEERRKLEDQLFQSQKLEAIGTLAGGVAHDFNNILTGVLGYAGLLKMQWRNESEIEHAATVIEKAALRGSQLVTQLLSFARHGTRQNIPIDLEATIEEAISLLRRTLEKNITICRSARLEKAIVLGDPGQMQQVLLNLAVNARDAMPEGGELCFGLQRVELDAAWCRGRAGLTPGPYYLLTVTDTGCGIPESIRTRIFEPFFTTKEQGKGTGMGLATVYGIVNAYGGSIEVQSQEGVGTTFGLYLPAASASADIAVAAADEELVFGSGRILLVDDDELARTAAADILRRLGYEVVTAGDGQEAVERFQNLEPHCDLVILDLLMPRMGGAQCFQILKQLEPGVKVILSTGYDFSEREQLNLTNGICGVIQKPLRMVELSRVVAKALQSS